MRFKDQRGVEYVFDANLHCGDVHDTTFCIVVPATTVTTGIASTRGLRSKTRRGCGCVEGGHHE